MNRVSGDLQNGYGSAIYTGLESWLQGVGAAGIYNLMEDAATAEISRAQIWQWINHPSTTLDDGRDVTLDLYHEFVSEEMENIRKLVGEARFSKGKFELARQLMDRLVSEKPFVDFLTLIAYDALD